MCIRIIKGCRKPHCTKSTVGDRANHGFETGPGPADESAGFMMGGVASKDFPHQLTFEMFALPTRIDFSRRSENLSPLMSA